MHEGQNQIVCETMKDSIIFNWPGGSSGDMLLSIANACKDNGTVSSYYPDTNRFYPEVDSEDNVIRQFDQNANADYYANRYDKLIHSHYIDNDVPDNIKIINIDNDGSQLTTSLLYIIKSRCLEEKIELGLMSVDDSSNYKHLFDNRTNFYNYSYHDIFFNCDMNLISDMYSKLGIDISNSVNKIKQIIEIYSHINMHILKTSTVKSIYENDVNFKDDGHKFFNLDELIELLLERQQKCMK